MNLLNQSAFLKTLGWCLVDSLWQMGVLWLLFVVITGNGRRFTAQQRHSLAMLSVGGGFVWFLINLIFRFQDIDESYANQPGTEFQPFITFLPDISLILPVLSVIYLIGIVFLFIRLIAQYNQTKKLYSSQLIKADPILRLFVQTIAERMGIKKPVHLWVSRFTDTPLTIGFWKPVILLPVAAVNQLDLEQAESIILHELNHIRRNDYLINLLIAFADIILFFNPFSRLLTDILKKERENSCDDMVLQFRYNPATYAKALLALEKQRVQHSLVAIAATGHRKKFLLNRVKRILSGEPCITPVSRRIIVMFFSAALLGLIDYYNPGKAIDPDSNKILIPLLATQESETTISFASTPAEADETGTEAKSEQNKQEQISLNTFIADQTEPVGEVENAFQEEFALNEMLIELNELNDQKQALMAEKARMAAEQVRFVNSELARSYSIIDKSVSVPVDVPATAIYPYVPSTSFNYYKVEDTTLPKKNIATLSDIKAKQALEKALMALEEIDWIKLEKEMKAAGNKADIAILQNEIKKAIAEVNWKKINNEIAGSLEEVQIDIEQSNEDIRKELEKFHKLQFQKQQKLQKVKEAIVEDRLFNIEHTEPLQPKKSTEKKKKTVHI